MALVAHKQPRHNAASRRPVTHGSLPRRPTWLYVVLAILAVTAGTAVGVFGSPHGTFVLVGVAVAGIAKKPTTLVGATLVMPLMIEEYPSGSRFVETASGLLTYGRNYYLLDLKGLSPAVCVMLAGAIGALIALVRGRSRLPEYATFILVLSCALGLVTMCLITLDIGVANITSVASMTLRVARPWLMFAGTFLLVSTYIHLGGSLQSLAFVVLATVAAHFVLVSLALATGGSGRVDNQANVLFDDAVTPYICSMLAVAVLCKPLPAKPRNRLVVLAIVAALLFMVIFSFRRSVWFALIAAALIGAAYINSALLRRGILGSSLSLGVLAVLFPTQLADAGLDRLASLFVLAAGGHTTDSSLSHATDIAIGVEAAVTSPIAGIGVLSPQIPGLVSESAFLYVHNDFLQVWLRLGAPGVLLFVTLIGCTAFKSISCLSARSVTSDPTDWIRVWAWLTCVTLPIPLMTAAFLSTTSRWPVLYAISAAIATSGVGRMGSGHSPTTSLASRETE